jgi:hypothetical protein
MGALAACSPAQEKAPAPPAASASADPAAVIRPLYARYTTPNAEFPDFEHQAPWSADLWTQLATMSARSDALNEPILDFDPLIGAQDYQLTNLNVTNEAVVEGSTAVVRAAFDNAGAHQEIVYDMVWEGGGWRVNNVRGDTDGTAWDLRQIAALPHA